MAVAGVALSAAVAAQYVGGRPEVKTLTLGNGMTVWVNEDHTRPKVFGAVVVKAGAKDCPGTGIAHYFEHILFKGTDRMGTVDYAAEKPWLDSIAAQYDRLAETGGAAERLALQKDINRLSRKAGEYAIPNEFSNLVSRYGGTGLNAYTSFDETVFHNTFTPQYLAQWAHLNSERLMNPVFRLFQSELETVYEEKNMHADSPLTGALEALQAHVFAGTPYASPIIGTTAHLKAPSLTRMREFYDKYYVAGNMGLVLCGDIQADSVAPLLERTFGRIRRGEAPTAAPFAVRPFREGERMAVKLPIPVVKAEGIIYRAPTDRDADNVAFELALALLSNATETGMLDSLANESRLMAAMAGKLDAFKELGIAGIGYVPNIPFGSKRRAGRMCMEQVEKLKEGRFGDEALESLKAEMLSRTERSLEDLESRAGMMVSAFSHGLPWDSVLARPERIRAVTKEAVVRAANKYLTDSCLRVTKKFGKYAKDRVSQPGYTPVTPKHAGGISSEYARMLERMPCRPLRPRLVDFGKDVGERRLDSLVTLYRVENPVNDIFELRLIYHKGTAASPVLAHVADYVTQLGTDSLTKQQLGRALQRIGARIEAEAAPDNVTITLSGFDSALRPALELLGRLMNGARPERKMFRDLVASEKISGRTLFRDNRQIAAAVMEKAMYGEASTFLDRPTPAELKAMGPGRLVEIFGELQENALSIAYSGRLGMDEVEGAVRGCLPLGKVRLPRSDSRRELQPCAEPVVYVFDNPDARQTVIGTYQCLPATPDTRSRACLWLWGSYFGSGMSSLMFQDIREFRSLAYYAYGYATGSSMALHPDAPTAYTTMLGTQADKAMAALGVLDTLLTDMPVRESGIAAARQDILNRVSNGFPSFRETGSSVARWKAWGYDGDPRRMLVDEVPGLDSRDVEDYYRKNVREAPRVTIVVGDKKSLDMQKLRTYGRIVELKKKDIYR